MGTTGKTGWMSPKNLWTSTITDQLKMAQNYQSKTIAIALKDRGAILPGGHTANAAYWYDSKEGRWISSSFYFNELPNWVQTFNSEERAFKYVQKVGIPCIRSKPIRKALKMKISLKENYLVKNPLAFHTN